MKRYAVLTPFLALALFAIANPASALPVVLVGTGTAALQHNGTTKIDITDPDDNNFINTAEWGFAPVVTTGAAGTFNPTNNGENWAKVFDNAVNAGGTWGSGTSKFCCSFVPGVTAITMTSDLAAYELSGYTISNGNDSPERRPTGWRLFGSNDDFTTSALLDTVTLADINGGLGWTANDQVGEVTFSGLTSSFNAFRFVFDTSQLGTNFQISEIELFGIESIPEPATATLALLALATLTVRRRRTV